MSKFFSSVNCTIFLNTKKVDTFYSLEFNRNESVMPVYSWRSQRFNELAKGQILVSGTLILNIKSANQLANIIMGKVQADNKEEQNREIEQSLNVAKELLESKLNNIEIKYPIPVPEELTAESTLARTNLNNAAIELARIRKANMMERQVSGAIADSKSIEEAIAKHDEVFNNTYIIEIHNNRNSEIDMLADVRFTGRASQVLAGSSQNIKYAFPFIAKDAVSKI